MPAKKAQEMPHENGALRVGPSSVLQHEHSAIIATLSYSISSFASIRAADPARYASLELQEMGSSKGAIFTRVPLQAGT